jgi:hypothetical protein
MSAIVAQKAVAEYHREIAQSAHHRHDMYLFHRDWHQQNRDPIPPGTPDPDWGADLIFGSNFLQMHHEMVKAADNEPKFHMMHASLVSWYQSKGYELPAEWDPLATIPATLDYDPDPDVYPPEIHDAIAEAAARAGVTPKDWLRRNADRPRFALPKYFTREGVAAGEAGERYTGARKLADFKNVNQLGCCLVFPHNSWHRAIGGAMRSTWTAIADPIFYFGVHWHIEKVFDEYQLIQAERAIRGLDRVALRLSGALPSAKVRAPKKFTDEQLVARERDIALGQELREPPHVVVARAAAASSNSVLTATLAQPRTMAMAAAKPARTQGAGAGARERLSIQALMAVPPAQHDKAWLLTALQRAIELEMFTIPPYLSASWSIEDNSHAVADLLFSVALDEMFHMGLACNLLNTLGGKPVIATPTAAPPYPGPLPGGVHPELKDVTPQALSKDLVLNVFMKIEEPDWKPAVTAFFAGETYKTIGQLYEAVLTAFQALDDTDIKGERQLKRGARLFPIKNKQDAAKAIQSIRQEGEGTPQLPNSIDGSPAHYYKFGQVFHEKEVALKDGKWIYDPAKPIPFPTVIYPMAPVPAGGYAKAKDFDKLYTEMLILLQDAWVNGDQAKLSSAITWMRKLAEPARALMQQALPGGGGNYGPSFQVIAD